MWEQRQSEEQRDTQSSNEPSEKSSTASLTCPARVGGFCRAPAAASHRLMPIIPKPTRTASQKPKSGCCSEPLPPHGGPAFCALQNPPPGQRVRVVGKSPALGPKPATPALAKGGGGEWLGGEGEGAAPATACRAPSAPEPPVSPASTSRGSKASAMLTWDIVNIAAIHKQVTVLGVAERRQIGGVRRAGPDEAPHAACRMKMESQSKGGGKEEKRRRRSAVGGEDCRK